MKRILFALTIAFLLPLTPRARAATDLSLNFFYNNLSPEEGNWIDVGDYGYCFQPNVAVNNPNWRPYSDGYWAYTDDGWTWVSYEDFGWATYHYGRWSRLSDYGWVWVPGYEWGPAWVSWRTGGDYVGWAPLPPAADRVSEGRAITGHVDVEFDIGPRYYNFVDVRYIGEPVLRNRIIEPQRNVTIINRTVNVTNITYRNSTVYNYGPNYNRLNEYSTRPIQRLSIQRESTWSGNLAGHGGGRRNFNRVNGNQLMVVAPQIQKGKERLAPKKVKATVKEPKFEHGWQGVSNRQQLQAEMKKENAKKIPPPTFKPQKGRKGEAAAAAENAATQPNKKANNNPQASQGPPRNGRKEEQTGKQPHKFQPEQRAGEQPSKPQPQAQKEEKPAKQAKPPTEHDQQHIRKAQKKETEKTAPPQNQTRKGREREQAQYPGHSHQKVKAQKKEAQKPQRPEKAQGSEHAPKAKHVERAPKIEKRQHEQQRPEPQAEKAKPPQAAGHPQRRGQAHHVQNGQRNEPQNTGEKKKKKGEKDHPDHP
ncbi:MAG TPA: DUF6600 domain-containing protein [Chthoniobacterales bacterium]